MWRAHVCRQLYVLCASHALVQATVGAGTIIIVYIGVPYTKGGGVHWCTLYKWGGGTLVYLIQRGGGYIGVLYTNGGGYIGVPYTKGGGTLVYLIQRGGGTLVYLIQRGGGTLRHPASNSLFPFPHGAPVPFPFPHTLRQCASGFKGSPTADCKANGQWEYKGSCAKIDCGAPGQAHVDYTGCGTGPGKCQGKCEAGYTGTPAATCGAAGWAYTGACQPNLCAPSQVPHSDFSAEGSLHGTTGKSFTVTCNQVPVC